MTHIKPQFNVPLKEAKGERFDPYEYNAGTSLAININNTLIIASDTRHSSTMGINSRYATKIYKLQDHYIVLTGFYADGFEVHTRMLYLLEDYKCQHGTNMGIKSVAHALHNLLYSRRFFPYYAYAIVAGYEKDELKVYSYDPVGSYQETKCRVDGTGACMVQPLLDSKISGLNNLSHVELSLDEVISVVKCAFESTAERDVMTGDSLEMYVVTKQGAERTIYELRKD